MSGEKSRGEKTGEGPDHVKSLLIVVESSGLTNILRVPLSFFLLGIF